MRHTVTDVGSKRVHAYVIEPPAGPSTDSVVLVPGLGLTHYALPTVHALAARGMTATLLDLPGFGHPEPNRTRPNIHAIGLLAAAYILRQPRAGRTTILGHSTGSQAALTAALTAQERHPNLTLVMAGPTFTPSQRRLPHLARAFVTAYRDDSVSQIRLNEIVRGWSEVPSILLSGLTDAPDDRVRRLRMPLSLTSGVHDSFAPLPWLERLAAHATASPRVRVSTQPGSHNNLYSHPQEVTDVVLDSLGA